MLVKKIHLTQTESSNLTFRPLANGWFKCNQTSQRTRRPAKYRAMTEKQFRNQYIQKQQKEATERAATYKASLPQVEVSWGQWNCPNCNRLNYGGTIDTIVKCKDCSNFYCAIKAHKKAQPKEKTYGVEIQ